MNQVTLTQQLILQYSSFNLDLQVDTLKLGKDKVIYIYIYIFGERENNI